MLTIVQSRCWRGFQQSLQKLQPGQLVATPPDLTFQTLHPEYLQPYKYCIQTNTYAIQETYMIAQRYGKLLLCGTYLMNLQTNTIAKTNVIEPDGSPILYLR